MTLQIDTAVLQFQNQKLVQKLETQKVEYSALENKFTQLKERQQPYDSTLKVVNKSWEEVIPVFVFTLVCMFDDLCHYTLIFDDLCHVYF